MSVNGSVVRSLLPSLVPVPTWFVSSFGTPLYIASTRNFCRGAVEVITCVWSLGSSVYLYVLSLQLAFNCIVFPASTFNAAFLPRCGLRSSHETRLYILSWIRSVPSSSVACLVGVGTCLYAVAWLSLPCMCVCGGVSVVRTKAAPPQKRAGKQSPCRRKYR